jgi:hypothetical protein
VVKMIPLDLGVKRTKVERIGRQNGFRALKCYLCHLESLCHTNELPMGWRWSPLMLAPKGKVYLTMI